MEAHILFDFKLFFNNGTVLNGLDQKKMEIKWYFF